MYNFNSAIQCMCLKSFAYIIYFDFHDASVLAFCDSCFNTCSGALVNIDASEVTIKNNTGDVIVLPGDRIAEINGRPMVAVAPNVLMAQAAKQKRLDFTVMHDPQLATVLVQNPPAVVARGMRGMPQIGLCTCMLGLPND